MIDIRQKYISLIRSRGEENRKALALLVSQRLLGNCISILRQELDSFVRLIYLGQVSDFRERERLMNQTLSGDRWTTLTTTGKLKQITDKDMVEKANFLKGYIRYVYKFGCGFIHLSNFHDYETINPFDRLDYSEQFNIAFYLHQYHGFPRGKELTVENISDLIPAIFDKVSSNLAYYFDSILSNKMID